MTYTGLRHVVDGSPTNPKRTPLREEYPRPRKLVQRRTLICRSGIGLDPVLIFVDDDGSCSRPETRHAGSENNGHKLFHAFAVQTFHGSDSLYCIRCPKSLDNAEWDRIVLDIPEGHRFTAAKEFYLKHGRQKPKKTSSQEPAPGFTFSDHGD